jgi:hypothetical protein
MGVNVYKDGGYNSFSFTDRNELCLSSQLNSHEYEMMTDRFEGLHLHKTVHSIELYTEDQHAAPMHFHLNFSYYQKNQAIQPLNNARCVVYRPLLFKSKQTWYEEELEFENMRRNHPHE